MTDRMSGPDAAGGRALSGGVVLHESDGVATVWLGRPEVRNAQTFSTWDGLIEASELISDNCRMVFLRGAGVDFSAGLDVRMMAPGGVPGEGDLADLIALDDQGIRDRIGGFQHAFTCWRSLRPVVVAVVHGRAIGAGFQLALGADVRILTEQASLCMAEPRLGLVPDLGGTRRLVELIGYSRAVEICATTRPVPAAEALAWGLANQVVADDAVEEHLAGLVETTAGLDPVAVVGVKFLLAQALTRSPEEQLAAEATVQTGMLRRVAKRTQ
ncbi:MAG: enoyl-CoA hydratase/isomerase family protein [Propionibacteriaceae bacterium]